MPEKPEVIVGKRSVWPFAVLLVIALAPVIYAVTGWPFAGPKKWVLWAIAPLMGVAGVMAFFTRIRADAEGIEMRRPLFGVTRIAWSDVAAVYRHELFAGSGTGVRSQDGRTIWLSDVYANRAEIEAFVEERVGDRKP